VGARNNAGKTMLRFQVPAELLPLHVERAILTVDLTAPARPVDVFADKGAAVAVLDSRNGPVGRFRFEIDRQEFLRPDADGGLHLGIAVGEAQKLLGEARASSEWKINNLQLELSGRTLEP